MPPPVAQPPIQSTPSSDTLPMGQEPAPLKPILAPICPSDPGYQHIKSRLSLAGQRLCDDLAKRSAIHRWINIHSLTRYGTPSAQDLNLILRIFGPRVQSFALNNEDFVGTESDERRPASPIIPWELDVSPWPYIRYLEIIDCSGLRQVTGLGECKHLRTLALRSCKNLDASATWHELLMLSALRRLDLMGSSLMDPETPQPTIFQNLNTIFYNNWWPDELQIRLYTADQTEYFLGIGDAKQSIDKTLDLISDGLFYRDTCRYSVTDDGYIMRKSIGKVMVNLDNDECENEIFNATKCDKIQPSDGGRKGPNPFASDADYEAYMTMMRDMVDDPDA